MNVFALDVPSLRHRQSDVALLVEHFVDRFAKRAGKRFRGLGKGSLELLQSYDWPGNIRKLQNPIERAVITLIPEQRFLSTNAGYPSFDRASPTKRKRSSLMRKRRFRLL